MKNEEFQKLIEEIQQPHTPEEKLAEAICAILNEVLPQTNTLSGIIKASQIEDGEPMKVKDFWGLKNPSLNVDGSIYFNEFKNAKFLYLDPITIKSDVGVAKKALSISGIETIVRRLDEDLNRQDLNLTLSLFVNVSANKSVIKVDDFDGKFFKSLIEEGFTHIFCSTSISKKFKDLDDKIEVLSILEMGKSNYINTLFKSSYKESFDSQNEEFFFAFNSKSNSNSEKITYPVRWKIIPYDSDKINFCFYQQIGWALDEVGVQGFIS